MIGFFEATDAILLGGIKCRNANAQAVCITKSLRNAITMKSRAARGLKKNTGARNAGIKLRKSAWPDTVTNPWRFVRRLPTGPITDAIVSVVRTGI